MTHADAIRQILDSAMHDLAAYLVMMPEHEQLPSDLQSTVKVLREELDELERRVAPNPQKKELITPTTGAHPGRMEGDEDGEDNELSFSEEPPRV